MGAVEQLKTKPRILPKDGDGDDGEFTPTENINIKSVANGWMVTTSFEDGTEVVEVFDTDGNDNGNLQTVQAVLESMGVEDEIKIK